MMLPHSLGPKSSSFCASIQSAASPVKLVDTPTPSPPVSNQPHPPSRHLSRPHHTQRTMRAEDFRGMNYKEDAERTAHRSFVRRLVDGRTRFPVLNPRRQVYDLMQIGIDAHLTTLEWTPVATAPDILLQRHGQATNTLNLDDVVSVVPWTHKMPKKKPTVMELNGGCWYFGVCVAYTKHRPQQLTMLCDNPAEQDQLVSSFRTLTRAAKQRQSALQLLERAKLAQLEPTRPATIVHPLTIPPRRC